MKLATFSICIFLSISTFAQIDIDNLSVARYGVSTAIMGDTLIFAGGDNFDSADFFTIEDGVIDIQEYTPNDGFESSKVLVGEDIAFFYDLTNVNTLLRSFYKYDKSTNEWSDGKYNVVFNEDVLFLDGELIHSFRDSDNDSTSIFNIKTNESYRIASDINEREFAVAEKGDFVYCIGGIFEDDSKSNALNIYNKSTKEWTSATLQQTTRNPNVIIHNNKLIISGGGWNFADNVESVVVDLPQSNKEGKLAASGNFLVVGAGSRNYAVTINLTTLEVSEQHVLEEDAISTGLGSIQAVSSGDQIIFGGDRFPRFHIFNTNSQSWSVIPMEAVRRDASMFKYKDKIFFVGGRDGDNNKTDAITVFDLVSSISVDELLTFNMFPNPTSDFLSVDIEENEEVEVQIFSNTGKLLVSSKSNKTIDLTSLRSGLYYVNLSKDGKKSIVQKLMIK